MIAGRPTALRSVGLEPVRAAARQWLARAHILCQGSRLSYFLGVLAPLGDAAEAHRPLCGAPPTVLQRRAEHDWRGGAPKAIAQAVTDSLESRTVPRLETVIRERVGARG